MVTIAAHMVIDEQLDDDGAVVRTRLVRAETGLRLEDDRGLDVAIEPAWVTAVMKRYGRELDDGIEPDDPELTLGPGIGLSRLMFRAIVDADSRGYLVLHQDGQAPLATLANGVAAALRHLATR